MAGHAEDMGKTMASSNPSEVAPAATPRGTDAAPVLEMRGISKRFGEIQALDDVSLDLIPGEIHALLGENGAGKSTLIKVMTGVVQPDIGDIFMDGQRVHIGNAFDAQTYAVAAIYQEPMVFPDLSVAENIFIGHRDRGRIVNKGRMRDEARKVLSRLDVDLDVQAPASTLTLAQQQTVEIAKALSLNTRVLIMDEPTASLSAHEVERLFDIVSRLKSEGVAILFISHRLEEVFEQADRISVMRDGAWISTTPRTQMTIDEAIRQMVGREVVEFYTPYRFPSGRGRPEGRGPGPRRHLPGRGLRVASGRGAGVRRPRRGPPHGRGPGPLRHQPRGPRTHPARWRTRCGSATRTMP